MADHVKGAALFDVHDDTVRHDIPSRPAECRMKFAPARNAGHIEFGTFMAACGHRTLDAHRLQPHRDEAARQLSEIAM